MIFDRSQGLGGRVTIKSIHGAVQCQRGRGPGRSVLSSSSLFANGETEAQASSMEWPKPSCHQGGNQLQQPPATAQLPCTPHPTGKRVHFKSFFLKSVKHSINIKALSNNFPMHRAPLRKKPASDFFGRTAHRAVFNLLASEILTGPIMVSVFLQ